MQTPDQKELSQLSRHYDSLIWPATSIWTAAIVVLLVHCYKDERADPWLAGFGLILTVFALFFPYRLRKMRRAVIEKMDAEMQELHSKVPGPRHWHVLPLIFLALIGLWAKPLLQISNPCWYPLPILALLAGIIAVGYMWYDEL